MMRMPRLGRPVYVTLGLAVSVLTVIYGGMALWPRLEASWRMRSLDRIWRDGSRSAAARAKAAEMLAEYGPEATPYLLEAARDADGGVREMAYTYLGSLEPMPEEAVAICLSALRRDGEPRARAKAAVALGSVAYAARDGRAADRRRIVLASLREAGHDPAAIVRLHALRAMVGAHAVEVDVSPWLEDADRSVQLAAAEAIFWLDPAHRRRAVPMLQAMVLQAGPDSPGVVLRSMSLLSRADPSACRGLVPTFVTWLGREDAEARGRVVLWLANLGPIARDATPALEAMLQGGRPADRARAAMAIIHIDPTGCDRAVASLLALLADAAASPRDRGLALQPFAAMFRHAGVPARIRDRTLSDLRTLPDQPGIHPELAVRIRQLIELQERPRPSASAFDPGGPRLISARRRGRIEAARAQ